jgi:hypothetical protein
LIHAAPVSSCQYSFAGTANNFRYEAGRIMAVFPV